MFGSRGSEPEQLQYRRGGRLPRGGAGTGHRLDPYHQQYESEERTEDVSAIGIARAALLARVPQDIDCEVVSGQATAIPAHAVIPPAAVRTQ
jgi:hypothetical protein